MKCVVGKSQVTYKQEYGCNVLPTGSPEYSRTKAQHFFDLIGESVGSCCSIASHQEERREDEIITEGDL